MEAAREHLQIPIQILIRPRPGDFCYSADEFRRMREDIQNAKNLRMDGVVVGVLDQKAQVDVARTRELVGICVPAAGHVPSGI
jgi:copper homeostasis protein